MDRRTYLSALGAGLALTAGCNQPTDDDPTEWPDGSEVPPGTATETRTTSTPAGSPTTTPDPFEREVDVVEDLGCDPGGEEPCGATLASAAEGKSLFRFPAGTYRFEEHTVLVELSSIGFVGEGDVTFLPPKGFNHRLLTVYAGTILFENIDVDLSASNTTAGMTLIAQDRLRVEGVQFRGRGDHRDPQVVNALSLGVRDPQGKGIVRNLVARKGSAIGHYKNGNGRVGVWVGHNHGGVLRLENCRLEQFGNNAIYASRCPGRVHVVDSTLRNNNVSSVRISGAGSYAENVDIEVDLRKYDGPRTRMDDQFNTRGIIVEQKNAEKPPGAEVRNCDVRILNSPSSQDVIDVGNTGRSLAVRDTNIRIDVDGTPAVWKKSPQKDGDNSVVLENVTITGDAAGSSAVFLNGAENSVLRNCTIEQTGSLRDGITLVNSPRSLVDGGSVDTTGYPLVLEVEDEFPPCLFMLGSTPQFETEVEDLTDASKVVSSRSSLGENDCFDGNLLDGVSDSAVDRIAVLRVSRNEVALFHLDDSS